MTAIAVELSHRTRENRAHRPDVVLDLAARGAELRFGVHRREVRVELTPGMPINVVHGTAEPALECDHGYHE